MKDIHEVAYSEREKILIEEQLKAYTEKVTRFLEQLEDESQETFVPYIADMALTWSLVMRMVARLGGEAGIKASRELLEETIERFLPQLAEIDKILKEEKDQSRRNRFEKSS